MDNGYYNGIAGLSVISRAQEMVAHNLANVDTAGYKAERPFVAALDQALAKAPGAQPALAGQALDLSPGPLRQTGGPLDVALEPGALLAIQTPAGERYTRDGRLAIDPATKSLVTLSGNAVLGEGGPIVAGEGAAQIMEDGTVVANGVSVGTLRIVQAPAAEALRPEGASVYAAAQPLAPVAETRVRPGFVEGSNVDPVAGTVALIEALRSFEAIAKANQMLMGDMAKSLFEESGRAVGR